jgi:adenylosuccinate synthase
VTCTVVVGGAFGDEGKGKVVSYLAVKDNVDVAARGGVGPNAGHTVVYNSKVLKLRMLPSAIVNEKTRLMIGPGVLVNPEVLVDEVSQYNVDGRLIIDRQCGIIERSHIERDKEGHLRDTITTTGTGTGPANSDRILRVARVAKDEPLLSKYIGDVAEEVNTAIDNKEKVLLEGTQATGLSIYHGTYPYTTSKDVTASAICADVGVGPRKVTDVIVVFKSYFTRVGAGPLENELPSDEILRRGWQEYGSVTGRPRRAAPFDIQVAKRSVMLNSASQIAITKLDVLFPETSHAQQYSNLSDAAKKFVEMIEAETGTDVTLIGTGNECYDIIDRREVRFA